MTTSNILFCLFLALPAIAIVLLIKRKYIQVGNEPPLPPPPLADPIVGHIHSIPRLYPWRTFSELWSRWGE